MNKAVIVAVAHVILLVAPGPGGFRASALGREQAVVIEATNLIDGRTGTWSGPVSIILQMGRIKSIGDPASVQVSPGARRIDGRRKWVIPGMVEFHSHDTSERRLRRALALGVTTAHTIADPSISLDLIKWSNRPDSATPRLRLTTALFGEFPEHIQPGRYSVRNPKTPTEARRDVAELRLGGASAVKIWQDDGELWFGTQGTFPRIPTDVFREIVEASHRLRMPVYAHAWKLRDAAVAIRSGVDALMHPVADGALDDALWQEMRDREIPWTTTMAVVIAYGDPRDYSRRILSDPRLKAALSPDELTRFERDASATLWPSHDLMPTLAAHCSAYMDVIKRNTLRARSLGVTITLGSDEIIGIGTHVEMELLQDMGLTPAEILVAATHGSAVALGLENAIGSLVEGKIADLVVLRTNPLLDIKNARDIEWVVKAGKLFSPEDLISPSGKK